MLVLFTINSVIDNIDDFGAPSGDPEINNTTVNGELIEVDGTLTMFYKEKNDETVTSTKIELRPDGSVMLRRMGGIVSDMLFIDGKETKTIYQIPPYKFDMTIKTKKIRSAFTDRSGELQLIYSMNIGGGQKNARMKITYKVQS